MQRTRGLRGNVVRAALATICTSSLARAGGFDIPDNGTQALGRGTAFVAKADDPTAIYHNPGGLARQRGTHALANVNLYLHSFDFQRLGRYPDDPQDPETPWGNQEYPLASNETSLYPSPFVAISSDFGYFDRLTFAAGLFTPPTIGNRTFPLGIDGKPGPSRYDFVQSRSVLYMPTLSAAVRVTPWLDVGVSGHLVLGRYDETMVTYADLGNQVCKSKESIRCDTRLDLAATGTAFGATIGAIARPSEALAFGASFRTPINITANGTATPEAPRGLSGQQLAPGAATLAYQLPWMARLGGRYIGMDGAFEQYDLELDLTYEGWGSAQATGPILDIDTLGGDFKNIEIVTLHGYQNTFGMRGGGAYNIDLGGDSTLALRGGAYFDSPATDFGFTRLDYDTLGKIAGTLGLGYRLGSFRVDVAYAAVASVPRVVGSAVGEIQPANPLRNGANTAATGDPLPFVNEGSYRGFTHILSAGIGVAIESLIGPQRPVHYGNPYEPYFVADEAAPPVETKKPEEPPPEEKKPEEKKPEEKKPEEKPVPPPPPPPVVEKPPPPPPPVEKPPPPPPPVEKPPPPPPPPVEKPPTKRKEWWEEAE